MNTRKINRIAALAQCAGIAAIIGSFFAERHSLLEDIFISLATVLIWGGACAFYYVWGYNRGRKDGHRAGHVEARQIIAEELNPTRWMPIKQSFGPNPLEAEHRQYLAADKAEEPTEWGTDYWGDIETEPSEEAARNVVQLSLGTKLYSRQPHCEWVKVEEPRLCDSQNVLATTKDDR